MKIVCPSTIPSSTNIPYRGNYEFSVREFTIGRNNDMQSITPKNTNGLQDDDEDDEDDIPNDLEPLTQTNIELSSNDRKRTKMEPLEIGHDDDDDNAVAVVHDDNDDLESLLRNQSTQNSPLMKNCCCCCPYERIGNVIFLCHKSPGRSSSSLLLCSSSPSHLCGDGLVIGPHWFGPMTVLFLVGWASSHFVLKAVTLIGPISAMICIGFMIGTIYFLLKTSFTDPGIVKQRCNMNPEDLVAEDYRWCDFCNVYQPPDGAHCPDCNVCISGYDHHCIWMGICIGKGNIKAFKMFNICWILYLLYCTLWVSFLGPIIKKHL
jgi:hypothetical protein